MDNNVVLFKHKSDKNHILLVKLLIFFALPIASVIWSLTDMRQKSSYIILFLYGALIGFCFTVNESTGFDSIRYVEVFNGIRYTFLFDFADWISLESNIHDFYLQTLAYVVSYFTSNYHFFLFSAALVFSFFCLKSLKFLTNQVEFKPNYTSICVIFLFLISNSIININGFRFWTASWYVVWCTFNIILNDKKVYLLFLPMALFFHSSMLVYVIVFIIYRLTRNRIKMWQTLSIASLIFSSLSIIIFQNLSSYLPEVFQSTINYYTERDYIAARNSGIGWSWLENLFSLGTTIFMTAVLLFINRNNRLFRLSDHQKYLYVFSLCLLSFANFTSSIPSLGARYIQIVCPFVAYFLIKFSGDRLYGKLAIMIPFLWSFQTVYLFTKIYLPLLPSDFFYSNVIWLLF